MLAWLVALAFSAEPSGAEPGAAGSTAPATPPTGPGPVEPVEPTVPASPADPVTTAGHRVNAAVSLYLAGETTQAKRILQAVLVDSETLTAHDRQDAYAWLADIQFAEQGAAAAQQVMATLLAENIDYPMDPMQHPAEFCDAFEHLRAELKVATPRTVRTHPYPWELGLPFGIGYFVDGRPLPGAAFGTLQIAGLTASVVTRVQMTRMQNSGDPPGIPEDDADAVDTFLTLRAVNLTSVCVGWGAWAVPFVVETARWSAHRPQVTNVSVGVGTVAVNGRF